MKRIGKATILAGVIASMGIGGIGCKSPSEDKTPLLAAMAVMANGGLAGTVVKGPVRNATVAVYALGADGTTVGPMEQTTTDSTGHFRFRNRFRGERLELEVQSGEYTDEATGTLIQLQTQDRLRLQLASTEGDGELTVSPLTTMAAERTRTRLRAGESDADGIVVRSRLDVAAMFGLSGTDPGTTAVDDLTDAGARPAATRAQTRYGLVLAGMSQLFLDGSQVPQDVPKLVTCYAADASDGIIDGNSGGSAISCPAAIGSVEAHGNLVQAMNTFMNNVRNQHRATLSGMAIPATSTAP